MARRYFGDLAINVLYEDVGRDGRYKVSVSGGGITYKTYITPAASGFGAGVAYDSPRAYDEIANSAVSFALDAEPDLEAAGFSGPHAGQFHRPKTGSKKNPRRLSARRRTARRNPSETFNVYLNGRLIDTVFQSGPFTTEEVKRSLVNHDGYDPRIVVKKQRKR